MNSAPLQYNFYPRMSESCLISQKCVHVFVLSFNKYGVWRHNNNLYPSFKEGCKRPKGPPSYRDQWSPLTPGSLDLLFSEHTVYMASAHVLTPTSLYRPLPNSCPVFITYPQVTPLVITQSETSLCPLSFKCT